jgi:uncharacterized protein
MFDPPVRLLLGLLTGIAFGFLLQKGRAAKFHVIMGQFLLKDWTVVKIMATAVAVGAVGVYVLVQAGVATLHVKPAQFGGVIAGGVLFGIGIALLGYCPGTSVAACGEGRRDAMVGVLGMLFGAGAYVALYPMLRPVIEAGADWGKVTLPQVTHTSPWLWVSGIGLAVLSAWLMSHRGQLLTTRIVMLLAAALLTFGPSDVSACPVCHSETGQQVRAGIFNEDFGRNVALTLLPFPLLFGIVAAIHHGWPAGSPRRLRDKANFDTKGTK